MKCEAPRTAHPSWGVVLDLIGNYCSCSKRDKHNCREIDAPPPCCWAWLLEVGIGLQAGWAMQKMELRAGVWHLSHQDRDSHHLGYSEGNRASVKMFISAHCYSLKSDRHVLKSYQNPLC